jgi:hypothetical protein
MRRHVGGAPTRRRAGFEPDPLALLTRPEEKYLPTAPRLLSWTRWATRVKAGAFARGIRVLSEARRCLELSGSQIYVS